MGLPNKWLSGHEHLQVKPACLIFFLIEITNNKPILNYIHLENFVNNASDITFRADDLLPVKTSYAMYFNAESSQNLFLILCFPK